MADQTIAERLEALGEAMLTALETRLDEGHMRRHPLMAPTQEWIERQTRIATMLLAEARERRREQWEGAQP